MREEKPKPPSWPRSVIKLAPGLALLLAAYYAARLKTDLSSLNGLVDAEGRIAGGDFVNIWAAARLALHGRIVELFDFEKFHKAQELFLGQGFVLHNWSYPPHIIPWVLGFGLLPYAVACFLWLAATFALYAFAVAYKRPQAWACAGMLLLAPASFQNVLAGQMGFVMGACLAGGLRLLPSRPVGAGIVFGFLSFKPQMALLVPVALIAERRWRTLMAMGVTVALLIGFSIAMFGLQPWVSYIDLVIPFQNDLIKASPKYEFSAMIPAPFMAARILGASVTQAYLLALPFGICGIFAVIFAFFRPADPERRAAILMTAIYLVTPYILIYDMTALTAAVVAYLVASKGRLLSFPETALIVIVWLLPIMVFWMNVAGIPLSPLILLAFLGWQIWKLRQERIVLAQPLLVS